MHFLLLVCSIKIFHHCSVWADEENKEPFASVDAIYEPVSISALLGSCDFDETVEWNKSDEENLRKSVISQMQFMCENGTDYSFCIVNLNRIKIFFDNTFTKQQRMFWQTKLTFLYPDNPYESAHLNLDTPIFDKESLSDLMAELSRYPNISVPGWAILDYERPPRIDPTLRLINLYVLPAGMAVIAATLFLAWLGIKIRTASTDREAAHLREYKALKRQRDFQRRQKESSNLDLVKKHLSYSDLRLAPRPPLDVDKQKRNIGSAICATVANTAIKLTAGTLELDHDLRLKLDPSSPSASPMSASVSASTSTSNTPDEKEKLDVKRMRRRSVEFRRRDTRAAISVGEKGLRIRTKFLLTPASKSKMDSSDSGGQSTRL